MSSKIMKIKNSILRMAQNLVILCLLILLTSESSMALPSEVKLDNGVTVIYEKIPGIKVVSVQCWIHTGSVNETEEISGISHFLEHILFKGTKSFAPGEIDRYLDTKGGYNNAFTSTDVTNYYVTIPKKEVEAAFKVVSDMVFNALFIPEEIEKEKPVVIQEINRKYDDPSYKMWQDVQEQLFSGTPYERQVIGTPDSVNGLNREKLIDYYNKYYHPENMTLVVVGDIEKGEVLKLANRYFLQKRDVAIGKMYKGNAKPLFKKSVDKVFNADVSMEYVVIGFPTDRQDINNVYANEVFAEILSGGEYSLLNEKLKNEKKLVVYASDLSFFNQYHGLFGVYGVMASGKSAKDFKKETMKIINDIINNKIEPIYIEKAKNRLKSKSIFQSENVSSLAQNIGFSYVLDFKEYYNNYNEGISNVTAKDISEAAKRLTSGAMYFGITTGK